MLGTVRSFIEGGVPKNGIAFRFPRVNLSSARDLVEWTTVPCQKVFKAEQFLILDGIGLSYVGLARTAPKNLVE